MPLSGKKAVAFACILTIVGAGAVAGATLSGDVVGDGTALVEQSIIIPDDAFTGADVSAEDAFVEVNGKGTRFTATARAFQGEKISFDLPIDSRSDSETTVRLNFEQTGGPSDLILDAVATGEDEFNDSIEIDPVVKVGNSTFRFQIGPQGADRVRLVTKVPAHAKPGFYNVTGQIEPIEGVPSE